MMVNYKQLQVGLSKKHVYGVRPIEGDYLISFFNIRMIMVAAMAMIAW
jgi:hypothetical protein